MANNFPVMPGMQLATLQYQVQIAEIGGATMTMPPGDLDLIYTTFGTNNGDGTQSFNYSLFDQDAHEANMKTLLNGLSAAMAANIGVPVPTVQAALTVQRTWIYSAPTQIDGQFPVYQVSDQMAYP
jgi:hypothetical protein